MKVIMFCLLSLLILSANLWAQAEPSSAPAVWERYNVGDQQVSFLFPKLPIVVSSLISCSEVEEVEKRSYYAYTENVVYEATLVSKRKSRIPTGCTGKVRFSSKLLTDRLNAIGMEKAASQPTVEQKEGRPVYNFVEETISRRIFDDLKNNRWVELAVHVRNDSRPNEEFLSSLQLESDAGKVIGEGAQRTLGDPDPKLGPSTGSGSDVLVTDAIRIIGKPRAVYTDAARTANEQGTVRLKLTLLANGTVGTVTPVTTLKYGLTEQAIAAAKKVVFLPKRINGTPVSVVLTFDYGFNIY